MNTTQSVSTLVQGSTGAVPAEPVLSIEVFDQWGPAVEPGAAARRCQLTRIDLVG